MKNKKKILAAALAVCLLGTISYSTLAWFNASQTVTNKFMVATTGGGLGGGTTPSTPQDKIFSLDLWEYVADEDADGTPDKKVNYRDDGTSDWAYDNILPGVSYIKQPTVENTGSYDQYIRVAVTLTNATLWHDILPAGYDLGTIFVGHDAAKWTRDESIKLQNGTNVPVIFDNKNTTELTDDTITYVYYLNDKLQPGDTASLFTHVKLPEQLTQEDMAKLIDASGEVKFDIIVRADAIQTQGILVDQTITPVAKATFEGANWTAEVGYNDRAVIPTP